MAVAADGRFLYISETVSIYLGLSQVSVTRSSEISMKPDEGERKRERDGRTSGLGVRGRKVITITRKRKRIKSNAGAACTNATCTISRKARDSRKV